MGKRRAQDMDAIERADREKQLQARDRKSTLYGGHVRCWAPAPWGGREMKLLIDVRTRTLGTIGGPVSKEAPVHVEADDYAHAEAAAIELREKWGYKAARARKAEAFRK